MTALRAALRVPLRAAVLALALGVLLTGSTHGAEPPAPADGGGHPHLFTQQHRDALWWWNGTWRPQTVPPGARLRIQLPGDPVRWIPHDGRDCHPTGAANALRRHARVTRTGSSKLPNQGRIDGLKNLYVFDYRVTGLGTAAICLRPEPESPKGIGLPPGDYVLTVLVGIPQSTLPLP
jgi:hypothetical protein